MRDVYWDVVKGFGVLLVLIGHVGGELVPYLYMYHVALFFFVAGYFFKVKYAADPFSYMGSRLQRLWWPCAKYAVFFAVLHNAACSLGFYTEQVGGLPYAMDGFIRAVFGAATLLTLEPFAGALWFMAMMILDLFVFCGMCGLLRCLPSRWLREGLLLLMTGLVYGAGCWMLAHQVVLAWNFHIACVLMPVVYMGYAYRKLEQRICLHWLGAMVAAGILFFIYRHTGTWVELSESRILGWQWFLLVNMAGMYGHLWLCRFLLRLRLLQWGLSCMGRHSLQVIALHFLAFRLVSMVRVYVEKMPVEALAAHPLPGYPLPEGSWWLMYIGCGILLPLAVLWPWKKLMVWMESLRSGWQRAAEDKGDV